MWNQACRWWKALTVIRGRSYLKYFFCYVMSKVIEWRGTRRHVQLAIPVSSSCMSRICCLSILDLSELWVGPACVEYLTFREATKFPLRPRDAHKFRTHSGNSACWHSLFLPLSCSTVSSTHLILWKFQCLAVEFYSEKGHLHKPYANSFPLLCGLLVPYSHQWKDSEHTRLLNSRIINLPLAVF